MTAIDPATGDRLHGTVAAETQQILTNMAHLLDAAGSSFAKAVKVNALIYSMLEYENMKQSIASSSRLTRRQGRCAGSG